MNDWKKAEKDFRDHWKRYGKNAVVFRLPDTAAAKATGGKGAFLQDQPADFLVIWRGEMFFAEVKFSTIKDKFPLQNISRKQVAHARRVIKAGGSYYFFIKSYQYDQWFRVPAQYILTSNKAHLRWDELGEYQW